MLLYGYDNIIIIIIWLSNEWRNIFVLRIKNIMSRFNYIQYYQTEVVYSLYLIFATKKFKLVLTKSLIIN